MKNMLILLLAVGVLALGCTWQRASTTPADLPLCQTEDSINCRWDSQLQGNGTGTSFIDVNGVTYYESAR